MTKYTTDWAGTMKTGPNDARGVVWVISKCLFRILLVLIIIFKYHCYFKGTGRFRGDDREDSRCVASRVLVILVIL
jgi:hypothetical protein